MGSSEAGASSIVAIKFYYLRKNILKNAKLEIRNCTSGQWMQIISDFEDGNIFQSHGYGLANSHSLDHLVLLEGNEIIACAQVRVYNYLFGVLKIAYIHHGPLWIKKDKAISTNTIAKILYGIKQRYSEDLGYLLIIRMEYFIHQPHSEDIQKVFSALGFVPGKECAVHLVVNVESSLEEIRKMLDQKWRNQLNAAERKGIDLISGTTIQLLEEYSILHNSMLKRKRLNGGKSFNRFFEAFKRMESAERPLIILAKSNGATVAGGIFPVIGNSGLYLYGSTNEEGMKHKASYLIQWEIIKLLKQKNISNYDLSGINPQTNPGTYHFKMGIGKNLGQICHYLPTYSIRRNIVHDWFYQILIKLKKI